MEWISIRERLPEDGQEVLTYCWYIRECQQIQTFYRAYKAMWKYGCLSFGPEDERVTHWMPLPAPPRC